jgi:hypothetical protein
LPKSVAIAKHRDLFYGSRCAHTPNHSRKAKAVAGAGLHNHREKGGIGVIRGSLFNDQTPTDKPGCRGKPDLKQKQRVTQSVTGKSSPITDRTRLTATVLPMMMNADFMAIAMMMVWRGGRRHDGGHGYCCGGKREYQGFHITPVKGRRTDEAGHAGGHGVTSVITANAAGSKGIIK